MSCELRVAALKKGLYVANLVIIQNAGTHRRHPVYRVIRRAINDVADVLVLAKHREKVHFSLGSPIAVFVIGDDNFHSDFACSLCVRHRVTHPRSHDHIGYDIEHRCHLMHRPDDYRVASHV